MSFFGTVLTSLVTLLHLYVFARLYSMRFGARRINRRWLVGIGAGVWLLFLLGRSYGGAQGFLPILLEVASMHWMGTVFILGAGIFLGDAASMFAFAVPKVAMRIRIAGLAVGVAAVVLAHVQGLRPPTVERYEVELAGLPAALDGTTVAMLSDMHAGEMLVGRRWLNARVDQVEALAPDCVVLVGDLFERGGDPAALAPVMQRLSAPLGVWAVRGNHDTSRPNRRDVTGEIIADAGIRLLTNEAVEVTDGLVMAGIDDLTSSRRRPGEGEANLDRALTDRPAGVTVFLSHSPWLTDEAAAAGVELMLSGHTHNGQIWPFNYIVRTRYPHLSGRYDIDAMALIVCRGTGTWGPRMRLWRNSEISLITLRAPAK